jgi:glutathione S-transferase
MIVVHHLENSRSHRILWLLEELGVPYEIVAYKRNKKTMLAPPELLKIHPLGKSPVIVDGANTIAESGAIIEYLVENYGPDRMAPAPGTPARQRYIYWMHYAEGSAMPILLLKLVFQRMPLGVPFFIRPIARAISKKAQTSFIDPQMARHMAYWNGELSKAPWFAGEAFSAADIQMSFPLEGAEARFNLDKYPAVRAFLEKVRGRPAYKRAIERGGALKLLGK